MQGSSGRCGSGGKQGGVEGSVGDMVQRQLGVVDSRGWDDVNGMAGQKGSVVGWDKRVAQRGEGEGG